MRSSFSLRAMVPHAFFLLGASLLPTVYGICFSPGPAFPAPNLTKDDKRLAPLLAKLDAYFANVTSAETVTPWLTNKTSFGVQVTSSEETIWEGYHTAPLLGNYTDSAPTDVTGDTVFRIASISKTFTVYTLLRQNGIDLDDPVTKWLPELAEGGKIDGVQWKDISIRSLASQLSGISRETGWDDMAAGAGYLGLIKDPIGMGFPPVAEENLSPCMTNLIGDDDRPCNGQDILSVAKMRNPIFAPNFRSTYSNAAFSILGQVIERITGKSYEDSVKDAVTAPLGMTNTGLRKPKDSQGIIPDIKNNWGTDIMAENPTAGIYSSPTDLSIYIRSILNSELLTSSQINEWLKPHSWTADLNSAYGMPWEIFRTTKITSDNRAIDIYGKGGSLHGYLSEILIIPEFNIGITILVAGEFSALNDLIIDISTRVLREMDVALREDARDRYAGVYSSSTLNSTIRVSVDKDGPGLLLKEWISNGTDFYPIYAGLKGAEFGIKDQSDGGEWQPRLIPTGLTQGSDGEVWRLILTKLKGEDTSGILFDNSCSTDVDTLMYGGVSVEEFVFGINDKGKVEGVTLSAFRVELEHVEGQVEKGEGKEGFTGFEEYMTGYGIRYQKPIMAHA